VPKCIFQDSEALLESEIHTHRHMHSHMDTIAEAGQYKGAVLPGNSPNPAQEDKEDVGDAVTLAETYTYFHEDMLGP
jgi:hypothetical protein